MVGLIPRRVAWSSSEEFSLVFSYLFTSEGDIQAQRFALERIKVWMSRGSCPQSIESTASLLELILRDTETVGTSSRPSQQELRLAYSMALIRFVNSLVDPLQTTYFARSIASLAAQLGLPLWFVELRHSATHEDLPGIVVLREAARQALDWLYSNYWLPTISPTAAAPLLPLAPLRILLKSYKALTKTSLKDVSKVSKLKNEILRVYRGFEGWVAEAEGLGRGREKAIEGLVEVLVEVGGLVPMAKKKRPNARSPDLSDDLLSLWMPLITKLEDNYEGFVEVLVLRMVELLSSTEPETTEGPTGFVDRSYAFSLMSWIVHFLDISDDEGQLSETVVKSCLVTSTTNTLALLELMAKTDPALAETVKPLIQVIRNTGSGLNIAIGDDEASIKLAEMERRMEEMDRMLSAPTIAKSDEFVSLNFVESTTNGNYITPVPVRVGGWKVVENWKPCPIGMLPGKKGVSLDLLS